ncbi:hypothetical protein ACP70R_011877 [Stipagrostis hirtigluma subsp. patula]
MLICDPDKKGTCKGVVTYAMSLPVLGLSDAIWSLGRPQPSSCRHDIY